MARGNAPGPLFRERFRNGDSLLGTTIKTPAGHAIEIFGELGFDFVMIDAEHAPFDRAGMDLAMLATRAARISSVVRVPDASASHILSALDMGATGVLVPHVSSTSIAQSVAAASRYRGGKRGFANTTRAGRYGSLGIAEHIAVNDAGTTVIAMIEDPSGVEAIEDIAKVEGIDGFFLGRGDLTVAMGETSVDVPQVRSAVERITAAARSNGKGLCAFAGSIAEAQWLRSLGTTMFLLSSDHGFMRQAAANALKDFAPAR